MYGAAGAKSSIGGWDRVYRTDLGSGRRHYGGGVMGWAVTCEGYGAAVT